MVCWEGGEHNTLVILSVFAILLFPVMHLTLTGTLDQNNTTASCCLSCVDYTRGSRLRVDPNWAEDMRPFASVLSL